MLEVRGTIVHNSRFHFPPPRVSNKSALIFWITVAAGVAAVVALLYLREGQLPSPTHVWKLGALLAAASTKRDYEVSSRRSAA